jgi:hypothetical protein
MATHTYHVEPPLHIHLVYTEGPTYHTLCGMGCGERHPSVRYQSALVTEVNHAVYCSADVCEDCRAVYLRRRHDFDKGSSY